MSMSNNTISNGTVINGAISKEYRKSFVQIIRNFISNVSSPSFLDNPKDVNTKDVERLIKTLNEKYPEEFKGNENTLIATFLFFYALIVVVSLFGNLVVCKTVFTGPGRKSTINLYIGNLSISDLMMTTINIPLELTEVLIRNWPLGSFLCKCLHLFGGMSVATSTLTMAFIALDRYQVIANPLRPRPSYKTTIRKIVFIWLIAFIVSFPYSLMSQVTIRFSIDYVTRCVIKYPYPGYFYRQVFTLIALALQFAAPLMISIITHVKICLIIWKRKSISAVVIEHEIYQREAKWKTIKMLILVLVIFAVCWLPLNIYHNYQDALRVQNFKKHRPVVWLTCHWFAMSSVCCNPFIYCWLNDRFRNLVKLHLQRIFTCRISRSQKPVFRSLVTASTNTNSSLRFSASSSQSKEFPPEVYVKQLLIQTPKNDEVSKKTLQHSTITETPKDRNCRTLLSPIIFITKYYFFQEKS